MEEKAPEGREAGNGRGSSVQTVANDGMADVREMNSDLVGTAGSDSHLEKAEFFELFEDPIVGQRGTAGAELGGHAGAAHGIAGNGRGDPGLRLFHSTMHQSQVDFLHAAVVELGGERAMGWVGAGDHKHAAGVAVEAVDDAGAQVAVDGRQPLPGGRGSVSEVVEEGVDERAARVSGACVDNHSGGFVYDDHVGVFIQNF